jgi:hypothetical protein
VDEACDCWLRTALAHGYSDLRSIHRKIGFIDVPGPKGQRFDYLGLDAEDHYLLSAHLGPGILYVIDVRTNSVVQSIPGVPGITGVEYIPGLHKVYTSNWREEKIGVVDLKTMKVVRQLPTAHKPNGSAPTPPEFRKIYVSNTNGKALTVVNVDTDEIVKTLPFKSETGMPQYDSVAQRIYLNLRSTNEIAVVDPATIRLSTSTRSPGVSTITAWLLTLSITARFFFVVVTERSRCSRWILARRWTIFHFLRVPTS